MFSSLLVLGCRWKLERLEDKVWDRYCDLYFSGHSKELGQHLQVKAGEGGRGVSWGGEESRVRGQPGVTKHALLSLRGPDLPESQPCPSVAWGKLHNASKPLSQHL